MSPNNWTSWRRTTHLQRNKSPSRYSTTKCKWPTQSSGRCWFLTICRSQCFRRWRTCSRVLTSWTWSSSKGPAPLCPFRSSILKIICNNLCRSSLSALRRAWHSRSSYKALSSVNFRIRWALRRPTWWLISICRRISSWTLRLSCSCRRKSRCCFMASKML